MRVWQIFWGEEAALRPTVGPAGIASTVGRDHAHLLELVRQEQGDTDQNHNQQGVDAHKHVRVIGHLR